jgi:hypothetical protein
MSQNTSSAVMQQRREPRDSLDFFPTPPWATRALVEHVIIGHGWRADRLAQMSVWEPACGIGSMAEPLREYFATVRTSDVFDYSDRYARQERVADFLWPDSESAVIKAKRVDWIITNPPFRVADQFVRRAVGIARVGVAMLVRTAFLESVDRWRELFDPIATRPYIVAQFAERVPMHKGRLDPKGSTATAYCWIVWRTDGQRLQIGPSMLWIPPCRKRLEKPHDYAAELLP